MSWYEVIKVNLAGLPAYSGTCPRCKQFIKTGDRCPLDLPAPSSEDSPEDIVLESCPMKVDDNAIHLE